MDPEMYPRRAFLANSAFALTGLSLWGWPSSSFGSTAPYTIQQVINRVIGAVPGGEKEETVDTFKAGDPTVTCSGVVTTFMATAEVIKKAAQLGANLIITHEPTYYNHLDRTEWLKDDPVYRFKKKLIEEHRIAIWRFHDYWHTVRPDGILHGLARLMKWEKYQIADRPGIFNIPPTTLEDLARLFKKNMRLVRPFIVGKPTMKCSSIALLPGAWGGQKQIELLSTEEFDVMVVGEVAEWETSEYIRDASFAGIQRGLIILGHAVSEEPGMEYLAEWLQPLLPGLKITHVPAGEAFIPV